MDNIRMVDLKGQHESIKEEIKLEIDQVLNNTSFINGPAVNEFQKDLEKFNQVKHVIPCANGTDALQIALMALDLKPGDEVITTDFTFISTIEVIALLRLKPVLVDIDINTFNLNINHIKRAITNKTKVILPVHIFGQVSDMEEIMKIARNNNIIVLEDNAQAIGAVYTNYKGKKLKSGAIGDISATSFFPSKNLGGYGDGGAIFTNNSLLEKKVRAIANHGMFKRYYHDYVGLNSRLDSIQAAILKVKLKYLDSYNEKRKKAAKIYNKFLEKRSDIIVPFIKGEIDSHVFHQYTIRVDSKKRDLLASFLQENKIPYGIYYPVPLHLQKAYVNNQFKNENFINTNKVVKEVISLPMHTELTFDQIEYISNKIIEFLKK
ncbi:MAG: transcriptional regulator [Flavobacteriaceae bacterium]|nr:transcriptional regulator [Flavobacteriaceae bacterium]|tara:strand:+ start:28867 stop:30000 length:1134 start_codon:yes stop_codon:yes gene_type:complete